MQPASRRNAATAAIGLIEPSSGVRKARPREIDAAGQNLSADRIVFSI
jgi:hypothetical protein